jgi:predicted Rossmann fold flavoprotein
MSMSSNASTPAEADIVIVGAGAAGLMAAIQAGRVMMVGGKAPHDAERRATHVPLNHAERGSTHAPLNHAERGSTHHAERRATPALPHRAPSIILLDGAAKIGAKILVAGGGRCNVTHHAVDESAYAGASRKAIRKLLLRFGVDRTVEFFRELGVELKREETGKLFPVTDKAQTVLDALLTAARDAGVRLLHPRRVTSIERVANDVDSRAGSPPMTRSPSPVHPFIVRGEWGEIRSRCLVLATGGQALPKSGSDGAGYAVVRALGHTTTGRIFPALVPLVVEPDHFLRTLSGIAAEATVRVRSSSGAVIAEFTNSTLCTHFGLSGPAVLDISRYYLDAKAHDKGATLTVNWLPRETFESLDKSFVEQAKRDAGSAGRFLRDRLLPERLAAALCASAGLEPGATMRTLSRDQRQRLSRAVTECIVPVTGDRGFTHAEVTAGGVPLTEVRLETMESRVCPGLYLVGEILDVDGRIGGFNFQWAWASGFVAGTAAARAASGGVE